MIKAVMTDMDGTYMKNAFTAIEENVGATERLRAQGIYVCAVTARNYALVRRMLALGGLEDYCINNNGCSIHEAKTGESLWSNPIPNDWVASALEACLAYQGVPIQVEIHTGERGIAFGPLKVGDTHAERENKKSGPAFQIPVPIADTIEQVLALGENKIELLRIFTTNGGPAVFSSDFYNTLVNSGEFVFTTSHPTVLELMATGSSKKIGVEKLAEILQLKREEIMCLGDGANDIGMIGWAGVGVAMDNASDKVKAAADYVSPRFDQGGFAEAIDRYVFQKEGKK